ncbi:MAG: hypothetical protein LBN08_04725 [Lactobacillales bacterium]|jgi:YbbR domain-containing protein|nr:hypothetical protein [Lactobacillales bacterium]
MGSKRFIVPTAALIIAIALFAYVKIQFYTTPATTTSVLNTAELKVPINFMYDNTKYYISNETTSVDVYLSSYNQLALRREANDATRTFKVNADLAQIQTGQVKVPLMIAGLDEGINAQLTPSEVSVYIDKKATKSFDVELFSNDKPFVDSSVKVTFDAQKVQVETGKSTMAKIAHVIVRVPSADQLKGNYNNALPVIAIDDAGNQLNVVTKPSQVNVTITNKTESSNG